MKHRLLFAIVAIALVGIATRTPAWAEEHPATSTVPVKMLVTVQGSHGKSIQDLKREDIIGKSRNDSFVVTQWTHAS
jgi:hypothetical protein